MTRGPRTPPFDRLVAEHGERVWRVCRALLPHADAEDAWSDAFLAALEAYDRLPADANHEAWLVTIAHRKAIDVLRRGARLVVGEVADRPAPDRSRDLDLACALALLTERQREAVVLHHLGGLPFVEVAAAMGCSADAARRASSDGMRALREQMGAADA